MKRKVVVAGHTCLDITPIFSGKKISGLDQVLKPGKLINAEGAKVYAGGTVVNTGLAMKKMGIETCLIGKVGTDEFGQMVQALFREHDAADHLIVDEQATTSYTMVLAFPGIDRVFIHSPGANDQFGWADIDENQLAGADWFHFGYPPLMKRTYERGGEELLRIFREVSEKGIITSLDMAAVDADSDAGRADWAAILKKVLPYVDFFMPSIEELYYMLDPERYEWLSERAGQRDLTETLSIAEDIEPLVDRVIAAGARNVLLKCGAPGVYYRTGNQDAFRKMEQRLGFSMQSWYQRQGFEKSYQPRAVVSGTGAGDTTIAGFISALLKGYSLDQSLQAATATGASCVETYDALSGILTVEEQLERIAGGLKKRD